jgi:hypothetical protein
VAERKNIFLIGRRGHAGDEDQLTEMLAFLWQEEPETLDRWLTTLGLPTDVSRADVETQFVLANGKRPDVSVRTKTDWTLVESKLGSGFGGTQVSDYLDALGNAKERRRALILLTQKPEAVPPDLSEHASDAKVQLISQRWHDMAPALEASDGAVEGEAIEGSLAQDFVQLLIQEGLVKPSPLSASTWTTWNAGFNVLLDLESFLDELDPHVQRLQPGSKKQSGHTRRWVYRVWRSGPFGLGLGFGAAASDRSPHTEPIIFAFVGNAEKSRDAAKAAVAAGSDAGGRWWRTEQLDASCGLVYEWPALAKSAASVVFAESHERQIDQAIAFLAETQDYFRGRGYLPA